VVIEMTMTLCRTRQGSGWQPNEPERCPQVRKLVGPGGVPSPSDSNDLFCPADTNAGFETKRQFPRLSSPRSPHPLVAPASNAERERAGPRPEVYGT
jgi:hypothetical protein